MDGTPRTFRSHTVWTRQQWANPWVQQEDIYCENLLFTCGPDFNRADLSYTYGKVENFGETEYRTNAIKELNDYYVKVIVTQTDGSTLTWYGVIVEDSRFQYGNGFNNVAEPTNSTVESGKQTFTAVGLEYLLERTPYVTSWARYYSPTTTIAEWEFQRGIAFNMGGGDERSRRLVGNMQQLGEKGVPVFASGLPHAETTGESPTQEWDAGSIIQYLLAYHPPKDAAGTDHLNWQPSIDTRASATLFSMRPKLDAHGMSIKAILDHLCDRRRLLSWKVSVNADDEVEIDVFAFNSTEIDLPGGGGTIIANTDTVEIELANDPRVISAPFVRDTTSYFHRVIARGAPVTLTLSLQVTPDTGQGHLDDDWTLALKNSYNAGASADGSYAGLPDDIARQGWNAAFRNSPTLERVYRYFKWDPQKVVSDIPSVTVNNKLIQLWPPGGRFLNSLPLKYDVTYTSISGTLPDAKPSDSIGEQARPMCFMKDTSYSGTRYFPLHRLDWERPIDDMLRTWAGSLRMRHDQLGFAIDITGAPQHVIAKNDFVPLDVDINPNDGTNSTTGFLKWEEMVVTLSVELDNFAEAQYPEPEIPAGVGSDVQKTLYLSVPERKMEYMAQNTVFGLTTAGALKKNTAAGWITDDSDKLLWVARIAYEWYSVPHRAFTYQFRSLDVPYHVGQLVTYLITTGAQLSADKTRVTTNSVITSIALDMRAGTYTLKTSFADFDARTAGGAL